jgi:hypothetical protein
MRLFEAPVTQAQPIATRAEILPQVSELQAIAGCINKSAQAGYCLQTPSKV